VLSLPSSTIPRLLFRDLHSVSKAPTPFHIRTTLANNVARTERAGKSSLWQKQALNHGSAYHAIARQPAQASNDFQADTLVSASNNRKSCCEIGGPKSHQNTPRSREKQQTHQPSSKGGEGEFWWSIPAAALRGSICVPFAYIHYMASHDVSLRMFRGLGNVRLIHIELVPRFSIRFLSANASLRVAFFAGGLLSIVVYRFCCPDTSCV
jgi:hypothetical protein